MPQPPMPKEAEADQFYEDLEDFLELNQKKKKRFYSHYWGLECKSKKSRDTWNNRLVWPWRIK